MNAYRKLTLKLILVGSSGVGKTSLVSSFFKQKFENQVVSTVAPAFCTASIEIDSHTTVDLQIWDTAGQEQYQSISQMFYRESHIALVCFDTSEVQSVERWVSRVREHAPDAKVFLVTTKSDLFMDKETEEAAVREGEQLAGKMRAKHFVTSALAGKNVSEVFESAAREAAVTDCVQRQAPPTRARAEEDGCC
jgi:small GTP-binding protein